MGLREVRLPDIGDFESVLIIDVLVRAGDVVDLDAPLITLETDKATLEVPSPTGGKIVELKVDIGDRVSRDDLILILEEVPQAALGRPASPAQTSTGAAGRGDRGETTDADVECDVLVLGSGPGGYSGAFRSADLGRRAVIVERFATLGGVCLNVGCIPSKAYLHVAAVAEEASTLAERGISFGPPAIDLEKLCGWKDRVVGKLTGGIAGMAKTRGVEVVRGTGRFLDPHHVEVELTAGPGRETTGEKTIVRFKQCIIAAGSRPVRLPFLPDDPRVVDSSAALELREVRRMLVVGGGIIGLEIATVYSALGARIDIVEMLDVLLSGADRDLARVWEKRNAHRFDRIMLGTRAVAAEARDDGVWVTFEGDRAPTEPERYDLVLEAVGRIPNGREIGADRAGVAVSESGFIMVDDQQRTNVPHIFAIGDISSAPMLAHKAVHEGHVAAEAAAGMNSHFDATVIPSVAYTDPEVAWVGITETEAERQGRDVGVARFPWSASGRAIANGRDEGFTKLLVDKESHRIVGGGIVGTGAGDLIAEIALAIEMGADAVDLGKTIHPHPTLSESIGMVAELYEGTCTDLPPQRRKSAGVQPGATVPRH